MLPPWSQNGVMDTMISDYATGENLLLLQQCQIVATVVAECPALTVCNYSNVTAGPWVNHGCHRIRKIVCVTNYFEALILCI